MLILAVASAATTLDKLKQIPPQFWMKLGIAIVALIVMFVILKKLAGTNKVVLGVVAFVIIMVVGVNWIYERNEPAFLTPIVDKIAPFLPSKGAYNAKQQTMPGQKK